MTFHRYAERALALSLTLIAVGAFCLLGPSQASAATSAVGTPIGGPQLAGRGVIVNLPPGVPPPPAMPGASFLLADMTTGQILVAKAPHVRHLPASTLKTLTALALIPLLNPSTRIMVRPQDVNVTGTHVGILPGTSYTVEKLLQGMLITSGNDAAYALARGGLSVTTTLAAMNATARAIGAADTTAKDPSGLDKVGQASSAYDLALIARAAMKLPDFRSIVRTKYSSLPGGRSADGKLKPGFRIGNHNKLLYNYPGAIGIKNGHTAAAKFTYVEAATRGGHTYLMTEMASPLGGWRPAAALLNWAFAHGQSLPPIGVLVEPGNPSTPTPGAQIAPGVPKPAAAPSARATSASQRARLPAGQPALPPWVVVVAGVSALALFGTWRRRRIVVGRRRTDPTPELDPRPERQPQPLASRTRDRMP